MGHFRWFHSSSAWWPFSFRWTVDFDSPVRSAISRTERPCRFRFLMVSRSSPALIGPTAHRFERSFVSLVAIQLPLNGGLRQSRPLGDLPNRATLRFQILDGVEIVAGLDRTHPPIDS